VVVAVFVWVGSEGGGGWRVSFVVAVAAVAPVGVDSWLEAVLEVGSDSGGGEGWKESVASMEKWSLREQPSSGCRIIMPTFACSTFHVPPTAVASPELVNM
jgi:hypothetical protein